MLLVCQLPLVAFYNKINLTQLLEQVIKRNEVRKPGLPTENPWVEVNSLANGRNSMSALSFSGPFFPHLTLSIRLKSENREEEVMDERRCFCSLTHLLYLAKYSKQIQTKQNSKLNYVLLCVFSWQQIRRGRLPRISYRSKCRANGSTTSWTQRAARFRTQSCLTTLLAWRGH